MTDNRVDPRTGRTLIEVPSRLAARLEYDGWVKNLVDAEDVPGADHLTMVCWVKNGYSIEPSGDRWAVYISRGPNIVDGKPVCKISPWDKGDPIPPDVIVGAVDALRAHGRSVDETAIAIGSLSDVLVRLQWAHGASGLASAAHSLVRHGLVVTPALLDELKPDSED